MSKEADEKTLQYLRAIHQTLHPNYIAEFQKQLTDVPQEFRLNECELCTQKSSSSFSGSVIVCNVKYVTHQKTCTNVCVYCKKACACEACAKPVKSICGLCENMSSTISKVSCGCTDSENPCMCRRCLKVMDPITKITEWIAWW